MKIAIKRCKNCGIVYDYQMSGPPMPGILESSDKYCNSCYIAVKEALSKITPLFRKDTEEAIDIPHKLLFKWEKEREEKIIEDNKKGKLIFRRSFAGLVRQDGLDSTCCVELEGKGEFKGRTFYFAYWIKSKEVESILEEIEIDCETGKKIGPWKEYQ